MQLILVIVIIAQLHQYAASVNIVHKGGSTFPSKFKVPAGVYELRRISEDEIGSIKSDRIVTVEQDQPIVKASSGLKSAYQHLKLQQGTSENYGHSQSGVVPSVPGASNGQDYTQIQRGFQSEVVSDGRRNYEYMQAQRGYQSHVVNQNSAPNVPSVPGSGVSKQAHRGHHAVRMSQAIPQTDNSHSGLGSAPSSQQYLQTPQQATQQDFQNYHVVNENSEGTASISLPGGYELAGNAQNYGHQSHQIPQGYQVVNEGPAAHVVNLPPNYANENDDYSGSGAGPLQAQPQNEAYTPYEGSYIPQNQQPELQYDVRRPQHGSMQIPLSFVGGIEGLQQQGQLWNMIRNSRKVSHSSPQRPYEKQEKECEHMPSSNK